MARFLDRADEGVFFADDGWALEVIGDSPAREDWAATILALVTQLDRKNQQGAS